MYDECDYYDNDVDFGSFADFGDGAEENDNEENDSEDNEDEDFDDSYYES